MQEGVTNTSITLVIFDCDGVLVDSWDGTMFMYNTVCRSMGRPPLNADEERFVFVSTLAQGFSRLLGPDRVEQALAMVQDMETSEIVQRIRPFPGVHRALDALASAGVAMAVCTNGGAEQHQVLAGHGLAEYFRMVVTSDEVEHPKPHPQGLELILGRMAVSREHAAFVGDSESDMRTAQAAGMRFWAFGKDAPEGDVRIPEFSWMHDQLDWLLEGDAS